MALNWLKMDQSGGLCEKAENDNREIVDSPNENADITANAVSQVGDSLTSLPVASENTTTLATTTCNIQPSSVSTVAAASVDMSTLASAADGKNSVVTADVVPTTNSMPLQDSSSRTSSDTANVMSTPINSSSNMLTSALLSASTSVVTKSNLNVGSSTATNSNSSEVKPEQKNLSYTPFKAPLATQAKMSVYDSNKVAAEMAEIDSFLKSLASGTSGRSSATTKPAPLSSGSKAAVNDIVVKPAADGSALGRIAQSYGDSDESSSSSSDESEDEEQGATVGIKMVTAPATVAMDTSEVEQSMKKVVVSSDSSDSSSSSSSDNELG